MRPSFEAQLERARLHEIRVAELAREHRYYVVPSYDYSGKGDDKAPKMAAPAGEQDLVLPDLQCFRSGEFRWLEVKFKTRASWRERGGYLTTGMNLRLYEDYIRVERVSGGKVFVLFLHEKEREARGDALARLQEYESHRYSGPKMGRGGMVFWPYEKLPSWGTLEQIDRPFSQSPPKPIRKAPIVGVLKPPVKARERQEPLKF